MKKYIFLSHLSLRSMITFLLFLIVSTLIVVSCRKTESNNEDQKEAFSEIQKAKEWYYGNFKKSAEWASSPQHGKKLPEWKMGQAGKIGNLEIIEFPLRQSKTSIPIPGINALTPADAKRIASASLTRAIIVKRKMDFISVKF